MEEQPKDTSFNMLKSARDIAFVLAIYLYFAGWIYKYFYLNYFTISTERAGIEFYTYLIYASNLFLHYFSDDCTIIVGMVVLISILWLQYALRGQFDEKPLEMVKIGCLVLLFPLLFFLAKNAGEKDAIIDAHSVQSALKPIRFIFTEDFLKLKSSHTTPDDSTYKSFIIQTNLTSGFRPITVSDKEYFIVYFDTTTNNGEYKLPSVFTIKKESIDYAYSY